MCDGSTYWGIYEKVWILNFRLRLVGLCLGIDHASSSVGQEEIGSFRSSLEVIC